MSKAFSCFTWNVENFGNNSRFSNGKLKPEFQSKVSDVITEVKKFDPDVFALFEVRSTDVFNEFMNHFTGYVFHITEGPQTQEILIGVKNHITAFITQKLEFKSGNTVLRPGVLITLLVDQIKYVVLFVHLKSLNSPVGWGLRDDMFNRIRNLKKAINAVAGDPSKANLIVAGDFNTMGMNYTYGDKDIDGEEELQRMGKMAKSSNYRMNLLSKTHNYTFHNGGATGLKGNLDHVFASDHLNFKDFNGSEVEVAGLTDHPEGSAAQVQWIAKYSDHAHLYFEVQKV